MHFATIEEVRQQIDQIDSELVAIIARRAACVKAAAAFKTDSAAVRAPQRVEQVIANVRAKAVQQGVPDIIIENTYRAMIAAFITYELNQHAQIQQHNKAAGSGL